MTQGKDEDPRRWRDATGPGGTVEAELGAVVRRLAEPEPPDELRVAHWQKEVSRQARARRGLVATAWWLRAPSWGVVVACVLLGSVATSLGAVALWRRAESRRVRADDARGAEGVRHRGHRRWRVAVAAPAVVDLSVGDEGAEIVVEDADATLTGSGITAPVRLGEGQAWREDTGAVASGAGVPAAPVALARAMRGPVALPPTQRPVRAAVTSAGHASPARGPVAPPSGLEPAPAPTPALAGTGEGESLSEGLRALRVQHDARLALRRLDAHERRFPGGALAREAALARVEALLALGRRKEALAVIDPLALTDGQGDRGVALARGELRAAEGRCTAAVGDFTRVLELEVGDELEARALYGRGACRLEDGDTAGARLDFATYARRFPAGAQRAAVGRALERLPE